MQTKLTALLCENREFRLSQESPPCFDEEGGDAHPDQCSFNTYKNSAATSDFESFTLDRRVNSNPFIVAAEVKCVTSDRNQELKVADIRQGGLIQQKNTDDVAIKSQQSGPKDISNQDGIFSQVQALDHIPSMRRQQSDYQPHHYSEKKDRLARRSLGGGPLIAKNHQLGLMISNNQRLSNSQLQQNFYKDSMEQNYNGGGGGSSTNISNNPIRQHNSDFMYLQRQHQMLSPKGPGGIDMSAILESTQGHPAQLGLIPFKQMSEPINNLQGNFGGIAKYQIPTGGGAQMFTERSSLFSQGTQVPNGGNGIITQYSRPKTNSPFPPFGSAGATAQSTRSAQKAAGSQNPLHQLGPFVPLTGDQLQDSSNSVPLVSQAPILNFPNMDQAESEEGGNPLLLRRHHFNSRGSRVQPQQQLQPLISDLNNTYSTSGGDNLSTSGGGNLNGSIGINAQNYNTNAPAAARSFHQRHQSRDILRIQVGNTSDQQIQPQFPGRQQQFLGNFNIGGTWTASSIIMSGPLNPNLAQCPNIMSVNAHSEAQSQNNTFHQLNDSYGGGNGTGGRQSPKTSSSEQSRNPYINEVNYQEQAHTQQQQQSYGYQRGHYNSESKPQRRQQQPEVQIPNLNPQFQQSQQVFMQNNFFIQQMLSSPSNHQLRHQGNVNTNTGAFNIQPQNTHQQQPSFDASLQGGTNSSNAFFDLMEMSSVLSSSGLVMGGGNESSNSNMGGGGGLQQQMTSQVMQRDVVGQVMGQPLSKEQLRIQVPKDISSRQSTQSRVRMNRLNKMMAASSSQHSNSQKQQDQPETDFKQEILNDIQNLQGTIQGGILGSSFAHSQHSETSSQQTRQPIWMQGMPQDSTTPEVQSQISHQQKLSNRQKLSLLNQSYRDLHQNELLSQSIIANTKIQLTPQQAAAHHTANQLARVNIGDFSQFNVAQPDFNVQGEQLVNAKNRNISGSRRQLHMIPSSQNESSGSGREHHSQKRFTSNDAAAQSMILNSNDAQLLIQPILNHHHSASESQPRVIDQTTFHSTGVPGAGSRESSQSNRQSTFCIEMGKAKPKILKNSLSSAYQVFMPISTKASSRGGNHRVFQGSEVQTSQGSRKNLEPMTQQNSPRRQGSKMKQQSSIQHRESLVAHSQRANEFSPTNPSYYITFNQDSHVENHKFNPVPNLIGTTGGLIGSSSGPGTGVAGPRTKKQSSISPNDNGKNSSETRRSRRFNPNNNLVRSDSKNSSHSKSRGELGATLSNNFLIKSRPNIRRVEVPSLPTNVTPLGGGCETPDDQEIVVKSANIIGINRKIKINRIVNRNQQPLPGTNTQVVQEVTTNVQEAVPTAPPLTSTRKTQQDSMSKLVAQHRSRMPSFDGVANSSNQRSQDSGVVQGVSIFKQVAVPHPVRVNDDLQMVSDEQQITGAGMRSPQRHNQSQIIEPINKGQLGTNRIVNSNGGSQNNLASIAGGHVRRQSQHVPMNVNQNQMLPPRHRSQQKINFSSRQESSAEPKAGSQVFTGQQVKATEMIGTLSLLQQNQNQLRLPSQELPIQNTGSFPSIMKQASQSKFEFISTAENLSGSAIPLDRTASFQSPVFDNQTLAQNSSQSSLHHRRSSRGFQGLSLTHAAQQQPQQLMLASTYELSNGGGGGGGPTAEIVKQQPSVFSPQGRGGGSMMRKRRLLPSNSREASANVVRNAAAADISERSASNRRLQHQNESQASTATFSQLVLAQQKIEQQAHTQSSPPLNSLDSQNSKGNFHYETPRIGAASLRQHQHMPRTMKDQQQPKIMKKQAHTTSGSSPVHQSEEAPNTRMLTRYQ